jgi:NAD(P)-dependent dehydrogenase (short-subunit alcohol dehydrogenase family)
MIIKKIDEYRCDGCGACDRTCMGDVIRMREGKASIAYPEDLGHLAVFLASDKASYITGKIIHMDGGIL